MKTKSGSCSIANLTSKEQLREDVAGALMPLCSDSSDKARASGVRAVGCVAELGLKPMQIQRIADLQPDCKAQNMCNSGIIVRSDVCFQRVEVDFIMLRGQ